MFILSNFRERIQTKPDSESPVSKVWCIKKDDTIRINLVEMSGELKMHSHPDADHSLMLIEGKVRAQVGDRLIEMSKGDFLSIPQGVPHKYWALETSYLVSMDAPYYDPAKTISLEPR